ncbi:GGDEF domain-containing protein [Thalassospira tepidiphila]|uniref:Diguanylate cyclase n=2 Tax=Thalassospira tepidiphila TaxID=393657 RepID=A0A853KZN3_9PROT|nr:GGDEF domain-containing protein [Thalassospira tepidiphila]NJB76620.1 diguanylate cyclase (GGDEF)-like protein [Thalassospira tepidiphila]OAZ09945.1 diguanylate cyclase [Thalassospira tepidiphila MCCC 1A03514]
MNKLLQVGIRVQVALATALLLVGLTVLMSFVVGKRSGADLQKQIGLGVSDIARQMADELDRTMWTHRGEVSVLSTLSVLQELEDTQQISSIVNRLSREIPIFTWIGVLDRDGTVVASTNDLLLGANIAQRPVFQYGKNGQFIGDVHDAKLLAEKFPLYNGEPIQFVDIAVPLFNKNDQFTGVFATHLSWEWADNVRKTLFAGQGIHRDVDIFVVSADGTVLLGADGAMVGSSLELDALQQAQRNNIGWKISTWPDGAEYLTGYAPADGHLDYAGLNWSILVRQPVEEALEPVYVLRRDIMAWGLVLSIVSSVIAWWGAGFFVGPIGKMARSIEAMKRGEIERLPDFDGAREIKILSNSLNALLAKLTEKDAALGQMEHIAHHDSLTGLGNRLALDVYFEHALAHADRHKTQLAVMMLDLDDFKPINDKFGHSAGDDVLREVAKRLRRCVRGGDLVVRLGGDEMVVVCHVGTSGEGEATMLAERILNDIQMPFITGGNRVSIHMSIGIALCPVHGKTIDVLLDQADDALYAAKARGKNCYVLASDDGEPSGSKSSLA